MRWTFGGLSPLLILLALWAAMALWPVLDAASRPVPLPSPTPSEPAEALRFSAPDGAVDLGVVDLGEGRDLEVPWRRVGTGPLRVRAVHTSCGCLSAGGLDGFLEPGASGTLRLRLAPHSRAGPFVVTARVFTDAAAPHDLATLKVRGFVGRRPVVRPPVLDLGRLAPGEEVERRLEVHLPPGWATGVVGASLRGLEGAVAVEPPILARRGGADVVVHVRAPEAEGPFHAEVEVDAGGTAPLPVPVQGRVAREERR